MTLKQGGRDKKTVDQLKLMLDLPNMTID